MNGVISDGPNRLRFFADDDAQCQALREAFKFCNELGIQPPKMLRMAVMTRAGFPSLAFLAQQELPHLFSSELVTLAAGSDDLSTLRFLVKQNYPVDPWEAFERSFRTFLMGCVDWIFHRFRPQLLEQLTPSRIDTLISFPPGRVLRSLGWLLKNGIPLAGTRAHYHVFSEARHDGVPALFRECLEKVPSILDLNLILILNSHPHPHPQPPVLTSFPSSMSPKFLSHWRTSARSIAPSPRSCVRLTRSEPFSLSARATRRRLNSASSPPRARGLPLGWRASIAAWNRCRSRRESLPSQLSQTSLRLLPSKEPSTFEVRMKTP